ncbi:MAG TPA: SDR family oxidoreductase [Pyrinomonadaceae bacterium]|nr:SDR family oxidoreductase [Pyrinomonadaceae bacterium]
MGVAGSVVLVVGAGRGIGRAAAEMFAAEGASGLVLASRNEAELMELEFKLERRKGASVLAVPTDATDACSVARLLDAARNRFGRIDTLVYTAGVGVLKPFAETTADELARLLQTNVVGAFNLCKAVLPLMEQQKSGRIIALPGILGRVPMSQAAANCASKYARTGMVKSLSLEYKRAGVRVSLLHLGGVNSGFWDSIQMRVQRERMLTVDAAARAVLFAARQDGEGVLNEIILQPESHQL